MTNSWRTTCCRGLATVLCLIVSYCVLLCLVSLDRFGDFRTGTRPLCGCSRVERFSMPSASLWATEAETSRARERARLTLGKVPGDKSTGHWTFWTFLNVCKKVCNVCNVWQPCVAGAKNVPDCVEQSEDGLLPFARFSVSHSMPTDHRSSVLAPRASSRRSRRSWRREKGERPEHESTACRRLSERNSRILPSGRARRSTSSMKRPLERFRDMRLHETP